MSDYRTLNRLILAKVESPSGTDAVPGLVDALKLENPVYSPNLESVETNEVTGALDSEAPIPGGGNAGMTFDILCKGPGTPGTAVEYDVMLKIAGFGETLTAADVTGTLAGASTTTLTLAGGASSVDDAYTGMVVATDGADTDARIITDYFGATKVATVSPEYAVAPTGEDYTIYANALYKPISTAIPTASVYLYDVPTPSQDLVLSKLLGSACNLTFRMPVRQPGRFSANLTGTLVSQTDVASPGTPTFASHVAPGFRGARVFLGGVATALNTFELDFGNTIQQTDDPAQEFGYGVAGITRRAIAGRINPPQQLIATVDPFNVWKNSTGQSFWAAWGSTAGNRCSIFLPDIRYTAVESQDDQGFLHRGLPFRSVGQNTGAYICFW